MTRALRVGFPAALAGTVAAKMGPTRSKGPAQTKSQRRFMRGRYPGTPRMPCTSRKHPVASQASTILACWRHFRRLLVLAMPTIRITAARTTTPQPLSASLMAGTKTTIVDTTPPDWNFGTAAPTCPISPRWDELTSFAHSRRCPKLEVRHPEPTACSDHSLVDLSLPARFWN